ncbi:hypothetical protein Tco_1190092, partial [Tanacetum coccineum]
YVYFTLINGLGCSLSEVRIEVPRPRLSGEVVVVRKRHKVQRRRRREVKDEEDPPLSPPNMYWEVVTLMVGEGAKELQLSRWRIRWDNGSADMLIQASVTFLHAALEALAENQRDQASYALSTCCAQGSFELFGT